MHGTINVKKKYDLLIEKGEVVPVHIMMA